MPRSYACPDCQRVFSTTELLSYGGVCPRCKKMLVSTVSTAQPGAGPKRASGPAGPGSFSPVGFRRKPRQWAQWEWSS